jgi:hypothetical protein
LRGFQYYGSAVHYRKDYPFFPLCPIDHPVTSVEIVDMERLGEIFSGLISF